MIDPASTHREAVLTIAYRLMSGRRISLARLGELNVVHEGARKQGSTWYPPVDRVTFDATRTRGEEEPPTVVDFMSREIRQSLAEHGHARVDGLGVFSTEDGDILFSPSSDLQHVVNHAYAHLEAHEQPHMKEDAFAVTKSAAEIPEQPSEPSTPSEPIEPVTDVPSEPVEPATDVPGPVHEPSSPSSGTSPPKPEAPPSDTAKSTPAADRGRRSAASFRDRRAARNGSLPWVIALVVAIPLIAIGIFVAIRVSDQTPQPTLPIVAEEAHEADAKPDEALQESTDTLGSKPNESDPSTAEAEEASPQATVEASPSSVVETPMAVATLARGMGGYTLITASTSREASASALLQSLRPLNLPSGVLYFDTEDGPLYRAALGQWPSAAAADSARQALSSELPQGTWVKRLN